MKANQENFMRCILAGDTIKSAAAQSGVSTRQAFRWMQDKEFRSALQDEQSRLSDELNSRLLSACIDALVTLQELLSAEFPPHIRRQSARDLLELRLRYLDMQDFELRLSELEKKQGG